MDRVPHSDTRIEYGSGVTFRNQDRMRIGVSRSDTRIVYGSGATFRYQDRKRIGVSRSDTRIVYGAECHVPTRGE